MKVTVELDSTYMQGGNLDEAICNKIVKEVVKKVWNKIKDKADDQIEKVAKAHVEEFLDDEIRKYAKAFVKTEKIEAPRRSDFDKDMITLDEYIRYMFDKSSKSDKIKKVVKKLASDYSDRVSDRYDMAFATQMITKMKEANLLKDDVSAALFETKPKED